MEEEELIDPLDMELPEEELHKLEKLQRALFEAENTTPDEVLDAFCSETTSIGGLKLFPFTAGHELFLTRLKHPLSRGNFHGWTPEDLLQAFFVFTRPSKELFKLYERGEYEDAFYEFLDDIPSVELEQASVDLVGHYIRSRATNVQLKAMDGVGSKKKAASVGG